MHRPRSGGFVMVGVVGGLTLAAEAGTSPSGDTGLLLVAVLAAVAFAVGHATRQFVSEVIVFLFIGILIGPEVVGLLDADGLRALEPLISLSLGAIVFGIGERLELPGLREILPTLGPLAAMENLLTFGLAFVLPWMAGVDVGVAYLLAAIALSTSPTTLVAVIASRRARGGFTNHALAATALNNVTSALLYGLGLPIVLATSSSSGASQGLLAFAQLLVASALIGFLGAMALRRWMSSVHRPGERLLFVLVVLLGVVAVSRAVGAPVVISTLVAGALVANDPRDTRPLFEALRTLEAPIFLVFFLVAGANVHFAELASVAGLAAAYVIGRGLGKWGGSWLGLETTRSGRRSGWAPQAGLALLPFAGMAIGLAAFTVEKAAAAGIEDIGSQVSAIVLGAVVIFELIGPITVARSLNRTGEAGQDVEESQDEADDAPHMVRHMLVPVSSVEMARRKGPQVVDLAASTGATLSVLHVVRPTGAEEIAPEDDAALSHIGQLAASRNVNFKAVVRAADSVVDAIVDVALDAAVDLIVIGEPVTRALDKGGGRRIVHEVAERVPASVRVIVIPTVLPAGERLGRGLTSELANQARLTGSDDAWSP